MSVQKQQAWATLEIKSFDDDARTFEGVASTPSPDRGEDIVEPLGAVFKLPIPLLWMHDSEHPVGQVTSAKATKNGISVKGSLTKVDEPASLKDELDRAWAMLKAKLVRGLSIGFLPLESTEIENSRWGRRFTSWEWIELSCVVVPMQAEAQITTVKQIKSIDEAQLAAASGTPRGVVRLKTLPGASGQIVMLLPPKGKHMKTIKERIAAFQAERMAKAARLQELVSKEDGGVTLDAAEKETFDTLSSEIEEIDGHLKRLERADELNKAALVPVTNESASQTAAALNAAAAASVRANSGIISVKANLEPGQKMARYALALKRARGNLNDAMSIVQNNKAWMDTSPELLTVFKTAVAAGDTTTAGWASELVYAQNLANEFIEYLRPKTIIGQISNFRRVPFNVRMGSQTAGSTGYWVGQGLPVPVSKLTTSSAALTLKKAAGLVVLDDELVRSSSPSAELLVRDDLAQANIALVDNTFINPNNGGVANVSPASVLYGVTPITVSGTDAAAIRTDVKAVFAAAIAADLDISQGVWVMTPTTALSLGLMQNALGQTEFPTIGINGGTWVGLPVVVSRYAAIAGSPQFGNIIALIFPREIFLADDGQVTISISNEASIEMLDNPTNASTGSTVATAMVSMFQTNSEAIKAVRYIDWLKRRTTAAAFIQTTAYA